MAWLDCSTTVAARPAPTNNRVPTRPVARTPLRSRFPPRAPKPCCSPSIPRKISATPSTTRPAARPRAPRKLPRTPNTSSGSASGERLNPCPASASSQMPLVAPRFAPNTTAIPAARWIRPELTKAMVSSDTRVLDCSSIVPPMPNSSPLRGVAVLRASHCSSRPPASCRRPSSRSCMPSRNIARPAHSCSQPALRQNDHASSAASTTTTRPRPFIPRSINAPNRALSAQRRIACEPGTRLPGRPRPTIHPHHGAHQ